MLRSMLRSEPQVEATVSVSSLLNKTEKLSPDATETLTVRETSITVQETSARDDGDGNADDDYVVNHDDKRAASVDLSSDRSARLPPSPKSADDDAHTPVDTDAAQTLGDTDKDSANASARARSEETPGTDETQPADAKARVNGGDAADDEPQAVADKPEVAAHKADAPADTSPKPPKQTDDEKAAKPAPTSEDNVFEIERIASHRVNKETSTVDFFVEWVGTATSWEPERELQVQVPDLVFEYWDAQGGRDKATGLEEFHVFRILDSTVEPPTYRVQWVGYRDTPADTTWEPRSLLRRVAPIALGLYESSNKKRAAKGKPGRPSKKAKTSRDASR